MSNTRLPVSGLDDPQWIKSTRSSNGQGCVRAATDGNTVLVGDTKDPDGPSLAVVGEAWTGFLGTVKEGAFDLV